MSEPQPTPGTIPGTTAAPAPPEGSAPDDRGPSPDVPGEAPPAAAGSGEARPASSVPGEARRLERPPGERYRTATPVARLARPRIGRAILGGLAAAMAVSVAIAFLRAILAYGPGIVIVAIVGGWLIGVAVRTGAWGGRPHERSRIPHLVAGTAGAVAWLLASIGAWLVAMAILPGSVRSFPERLAGTPFTDWIAPQLGALDAIELVLLVVAAAWCARTRVLEPRDDEAR